QCLRFLVALAGQQNDVSWFCLPDSNLDRLGAIEFNNKLDIGRFKSRQYVTQDCLGILTPRIVRGEHDKIAPLTSAAPHQRAFCPVAVTSAAEERDNSAFCGFYEFACQRSEIPQRIIRVRVVDHHSERLSHIDRLKAPRNVRQRCTAYSNFTQTKIPCIRSSRRGEQVVDIHLPRQSCANSDGARRRDQSEVGTLR